MFRSIAFLVALATTSLVQSSESATMTLAVEKVTSKANCNDGTGVIPLKKSQHESAYVGKLQIGTPPQDFNVLFGTGSMVVWAPNYKVGKHAVYNSAASSTFVKNGTYYQVIYGGDKLVTGFVSVDTVHLGGFSVPNTKIMEASNTSGYAGFEEFEFDGYFGLGLDIEGPYKLPNPVQQLAMEGKFDKPQFAFYLGDKAAPELTLGGVNPARFTGDINYVPVVSTGAWWIQLDGVNVETTKVVTEQYYTMISSGSSRISGPPSQLDAIAKAVGATKTEDDDYTLDCHATGPAITFTFGGKPYVFEKADYTEHGDDGKCFLDIGNTGDEFWELGDSFLKKYYTVFDFGTKTTDARVGFAQAV